MAEGKYIIRIVKRQRSKRHPEQNVTCYVGKCRKCEKEVIIVACAWERWHGWCHPCAVRRPHNPESGKCGVYAIRNTLNGKAYFGSTTDWYRRRYTHRRELRLGKHHCQHLQRAWNKYREDAFEFVWLEDVPRELLFDAEDRLLSENKDKYNTGMVAGAAWLNGEYGGQKHTPETIEKLRRLATGRPCSPETREKLRRANLGKRYSRETREKVGAASRGKKFTAEMSKRHRRKGYWWNKTRQNWDVGVSLGGCVYRWRRETEEEAQNVVQIVRQQFDGGLPIEPPPRVANKCGGMSGRRRGKKKGYSWYPNQKKWRARVGDPGVHIGMFQTEQEAIAAVAAYREAMG